MRSTRLEHLHEIAGSLMKNGKILVAHNFSSFLFSLFIKNLYWLSMLSNVFTKLQHNIMTLYRSCFHKQRIGQFGPCDWQTESRYIRICACDICFMRGHQMHIVLSDQNWNWFCQWTCSCSDAHFRPTEWVQQLAVHIFFATSSLPFSCRVKSCRSQTQLEMDGNGISWECRGGLNTKLRANLCGVYTQRNWRWSRRSNQTYYSRSHAGLCPPSRPCPSQPVCYVGWHLDFVRIPDATNMMGHVSMIFHHWPFSLQMRQWPLPLNPMVPSQLVRCELSSYSWRLTPPLWSRPFHLVSNWTNPNLVNNFKMSFVFVADFWVVAELTLNRFLVCCRKNWRNTAPVRNSLFRELCIHCCATHGLSSSS